MGASWVPTDLAHPDVRCAAKLGHGDGGTVYRIEVSGRSCALKLGGTGRLDALLTEAERLLSCRSARLPELLQLGELPTALALPGEPAAAAGTPYLLLSYAPGQALSRLRPHPNAVDVARLLLRDVGQALSDLHRTGFAHGDVKADNIVVCLDDTLAGCTLLDLGLSHPLQEQLPRGATPRYLPPEVFDAERPSDGRARDLWALGLTVLEWLVPEAGDSAQPQLELERFLAQVPAPLQATLRALLNTDPRARPQADWVSRQAGLGVRGGAAQALARIQTSYLSQHRRGLERVARGKRYRVRVSGAAGQLLESCCQAFAQLARLRKVRSLEEQELFDELNESTQRRWLLDLIGLGSLDFPTLPKEADSKLLERLLAAGEKCPVESFTYAQLYLNAEQPNQALPEELSELALLLGAEAPREDVLRALERLALNGQTPPAVSLALARALKRRHAGARALAVLDALQGPEAMLERASVFARLGDFARAEGLARQVLATGALEPELASDVHALLARLCLQRGEPDAARAELLEQPKTLRALESRASWELSVGKLEAARQTLSESLAFSHSAEERARIEALLANLEQQAGNSEQSLQRFRKAAEHAARSGALLEEATYLIGVASTATNLGLLAEAIATAERSALLFEHLQQPDRAARALLNKASALAAVGALPEAAEAAELSRRLARRGRDQRCEAYAHLVLCDVLEPEQAKEHVARAQSLLPGASAEDALQLQTRRLLLGLLPEPAAHDSAASRDLPADLRIEWWGARARQHLLEQSDERVEPLLDELCSLIYASNNALVQGPAFTRGAQLAASKGDGERTRTLAAAAAAALRRLSTGLPPELHSRLMQLDWVKAVTPHETPSVSAAQVGDLETLIHSLSERQHLRTLLDRSLDALVRWTSVERGLLLLTAPGGRLQPRAARNLARTDLEGEQLKLSTSLAERALHTRECVVAMDAAGELPSVHQSVHALKLRSVLAVPLMARGEVLGVAYLDDRMRSGAFGKRELGWVRLVGTLVAVAIADARDQLLLRRAVRRARQAERRVTELLAKRETALLVANQELARSRARRTRFDYEQIVGESQRIQDLLLLVDRLVPTDIPVLVLGPSGSGKELIARALHFNGPRREGPFVTENCSAIPESLLESTLFGHVKGAFTGAQRHHAGLFEVAHGGTLFLDEIADMSLGMQAKLLRVLENGEIRRVGSEKTLKVDVRVIGATHKDLEQMVRDKSFREDLYYRLNVFTLRIPSLTDRAEDIPLLVKHFLAKFAHGRKVTLAPGVLEILCAYAWPGNVRQLENEIRRALVLADDEIRREHLSPALANDDRAVSGDGLNLRQRLDLLETQLVRRALEQTGGNQTKAAQLLGVSRFGLQKMIRRLSIHVEEARPTPSG